jgi:hypothetical protein
MAKSATELYHVPLKKTEFTIGDVTFPIKLGLLSTVTNLQQNVDKKTLRLIGPLMGAVTRNVEKIQQLLITYAQLEWYQAKGSLVAPPSVIESYNKAVKEAAVEDQQPEPTSSTEGAAPAVKKERTGTRPYCRKLIDEGERDENVLLAKVKEAYPDKPFKLGDVRGCLRNAGVLGWTARKGAKKAAAE